jgi:predicted lipoprotein with Yx(FWY)xxD motif
MNNHHPLYFFAKDVRMGETMGEGLNAFAAEWSAISAAGAKVENENAATGSGY